MCKIHNPRVIDKCLRRLINNLNEYFGDDVKTVACCCGHGKYPISIIIKEYSPDSKSFLTWDWCSDKMIPRARKYYRKDKQGYYYIPETVLPTKHNSRLKTLKRL